MSSTSAPSVGGSSPFKQVKKHANATDDESSAPKKLRFPVAGAFPFDAEPVAVIVGKEKNKFFVHECIICASSDFFKNALKGDWKESATRTVELPTQDPTIFKIYINWLYFGRFFITADGSRITKEGGIDWSKEWCRWSACYTLGSFLLDTAFGDALIDMAREKMSSESVYNTDSAQVVYPASIPGSQHRKFIVDVAIKVWPDFNFKGKKKDNFPPEFLLDLITAMGGKLRAGGVESQNPRKFLKDIDTCECHDHTLNNTSCYIERRKHCP